MSDPNQWHIVKLEVKKQVGETKVVSLTLEGLCRMADYQELVVTQWNNHPAWITLPQQELPLQAQLEPPTQIRDAKEAES